MIEHLVADDQAPRKPLALIKRSELRRRRKISRSQEWREIRNNPAWPRLVVINGIGYYVESEAEQFLADLIAQRDGANDAPAELPEPPEEPRYLPVGPGLCRSCGVPLVPTGKRGRPPVRCTDCRAQRDAEPNRG